MKKFLRYFYALVLLFSLTFVFYGCSLDAERGFSAYEIAVRHGFEGSEQDWLDSLVARGKSAYDLAVEAGFVGTQAQWLASLKGPSAYQIALDNGFEGDVAEWLASLLNIDFGNDTETMARGLFNLGVEMGVYSNDGDGYLAFLDDFGIAQLKNSAILEMQLTAKLLNQVVAIFTEQGAGSGVIYQINNVYNYAYIITNYHVIVLAEEGEPGASKTYAPAEDIYLYTYGMQTPYVQSNDEYDFGTDFFMAEYVGGAAEYDLAVLKISGDDFTKFSATDAMEITFADTKNLQPKTNVIAIGNPLGEGISVTSGTVSVPNEAVVVKIADGDRRFRELRTDAPINGGNSGGGVFDIVTGDLVGIANAKYESIKIENVANAILATNVKNVTENIIYYYEKKLEDEGETDKTVGVHRFAIGITSRLINQKNTFDPVNFTNTITSDARVEEVGPGSVAQSVGMQVGDIVKGIKVKKAGETTYETIYFNMIFELTDYMLTVREGDEIILVIVAFDEVSGEYASSESDLDEFTITSAGLFEVKNNYILG